METKKLYRPAAILSGVAAFMLAVVAACPSFAQDKKEHTVTAVVKSSPGKDKKEQKYTVITKADSKDRDGKANIRIIKNVDGKVTEIDTVISLKDGLDSDEIRVLVDDLKNHENDMQAHMKDMQIFMECVKDSVSDSLGHKKFYKFKLNGNSCCPNMHIKGLPEDFSYNFEIPEVPDFPEYFDQELFNHWTPGPRVLSMPKQGETLADVLGNIPMSRVKSYKVTDKKGGKRIVIELEDGPYFESGNNVIYMQAPGRSGYGPRGSRHQKDMKVIIRSGDEKEDAGENDVPPPPAEPKKVEKDSPKI